MALRKIVIFTGCAFPETAIAKINAADMLKDQRSNVVFCIRHFFFGMCWDAGNKEGQNAFEAVHRVCKLACPRP